MPTLSNVRRTACGREAFMIITFAHLALARAQRGRGRDPRKREGEGWG